MPGRTRASACSKTHAPVEHDDDARRLGARDRLDVDDARHVLRRLGALRGGRVDERPPPPRAPWSMEVTTSRTLAAGRKDDSIAVACSAETREARPSACAHRRPGQHPLRPGPIGPALHAIELGVRDARVMCDLTGQKRRAPPAAHAPGKPQVRRRVPEQQGNLPRRPASVPPCERPGSTTVPART